MFSSLLAPFVPYIVAAAAAAFGAALLYVKWLRGSNEKLRTSNAQLEQANRSNVEAIVQLQQDQQRYNDSVKKATSDDAVAVAEKAKAESAVATIKGSDSNVLTAEDIAKLKAAGVDVKEAGK